MRSIPVDTSALTFVCVAAPRPKLVDQNTGEVKVDRHGRTVYTVKLTAADENGNVDLITVAVGGDPQISVGQVVTVSGLVAFPWEQHTGGRTRWGIAYRADHITPAHPAAPAVPSSPVGVPGVSVPAEMA
ncbi:MULTISPECIES: hypothetical protein [Thermomonospora]|uniref:Regulatory protein n=1 Tax=Thermomonospora curvata (strain ATCC 19995 / DSM 43183 / JCM 3096 / KCTC 9072 / NBRC 15933 / NCIMB 10081 / Henssen B9) TaxID=471852 RepID=D1A571_THECD|nr:MULTISPECIES: hypothetical protein [Thermomonospora]ACZ00057.1 hypothetical protein Tcur_4529 [Thermomonospora curvata DSM 43183]PKK11893.1 MAG: hypothetical protein BUE48_022255 [Thermomonospora sp. CIF 1]TNY38049.1 hypothetical protein EIO00_05705 [Thermomonospora catenispora]